MSSADEAVALKAAVDKHFASVNHTYVDRVSQKSSLLLIWIDYLRKSSKNANSSRLLDAVQGAIIETAGCLTLGAVRPAIFSLRVQLELLVAWVYFDDHPIEWSNVESGKRDFPMRSFYLRYFSEYGPGFSDRMKILEKKSSRSSDDLYGILSVYVHSTSAYSAPKVGPLAAIVSTVSRCDECIQLQHEVAEYLTDILSAWFAKKWHDLPEAIRVHLSGRLAPSELSDFCA